MKTSKFFEFGFATKRDLQELSEDRDYVANLNKKFFTELK